MSGAAVTGLLRSASVRAQTEVSLPYSNRPDVHSNRSATLSTLFPGRMGNLSPGFRPQSGARGASKTPRRFGLRTSILWHQWQTWPTLSAKEIAWSHFSYRIPPPWSPSRTSADSAFGSTARESQGCARSSPAAAVICGRRHPSALRFADGWQP